MDKLDQLAEIIKREMQRSKEEQRKQKRYDDNNEIWRCEGEIGAFQSVLAEIENLKRQ